MIPGTHSTAVRQFERSAERRKSVASLAALIGLSLAGARTPRYLRDRFEKELRSLLNARSVDLRDGIASTRSAAGFISVPITLGDLTLGAIDITRDADATFDEWDRQTLDCARHLATLVLVIERAVRGGLFGGLRGQPDGAAPIIGSSAGIRAVRERIERVAATDFAVLIEGETGCGKELVARQIHDLSPRRHGPFVALNCAAIVETLLESELFGIEERIATGVRARRGKFEHAHDGTLFLDEVADLSPAAQAKLLRAIQEMSIERVGGTTSRRVDVRVDRGDESASGGPGGAGQVSPRSVLPAQFRRNCRSAAAGPSG